MGFTIEKLEFYDYLNGKNAIVCHPSISGDEIFVTPYFSCLDLSSPR